MAKKLDNNEYWADRAVKRAESKWKTEAQTEKELAKQYNMALDSIRLKVTDIYTKYATDNKLTYGEAVLLLNTGELELYRARIQQLANQAPTDEIKAEIELFLRSKEVTRLNALANEINAELYTLGYTAQQTIEESLSKSYETTVYETVFDNAVRTGFFFGAVKLSVDAIKEAIRVPIAGTSFSDAIWDNRALLAKNLKRTITEGLMHGYGNQKMARDLASAMDSNYKNSLRIIRTETGKVVARGTHDGYKRSRTVQKYQIQATLDRRTSKICQHQHLKVYTLDEFQEGSTAPSFHPSCRTCIVPYYDEEDLAEAEMWANKKDGGVRKVPANTSYSEWYEKYVNGAM